MLLSSLLHSPKNKIIVDTHRNQVATPKESTNMELIVLTHS